MSESDESIYHIEGIKNIVEQQKLYTAKIKINETPKEFIIDTGSPVTIIPLDEQIMYTTEIQKITNRYQDVNKNEVKIRGKIPEDMEYENNKQKMKILITERTDITPLLGMDWMKKFKLIIGRIQLTETNQSEKEKVINKFPDLFENNRTIEDTETNINIHLKPGHYPLKQKARPIPLHLQEDVGRELEKLIKAGHLEKINNVDEGLFRITGSDNSGERQIKRRPHMPNMEELLNQISVKITQNRTLQLFISKIDLDYAYGQLKLSEN